MNTNFFNIASNYKNEFDSLVDHPLQTFAWGEFREKTGIKVIRRGLLNNKKLIEVYQMTLHKIPFTKFNIGYLPKGNLPNKKLLEDLFKVGRDNNCVFIQIEPNLTAQNAEFKMRNLIHNSKFIILNSFHPLFTKNTLILDLTKTEEELLKNMNSKTRYNIRIAQKHKIFIKEEFNKNAFEIYWKIMTETTNRQKFYAHTKKYHELMFESLKISNLKSEIQDKNSLQAHLFIAYYNFSKVKIIPLVAWILFSFKDTLYYPYGSSASEYRNLMASNLMMWEAIKFGKKSGLSKFDMWGSLGENPDANDPWFGFHKFKLGYNPKLIEFIGSYDLIINKNLYQIYKLADYLRKLYLKIKKH